MAQISDIVTINRASAGTYFDAAGVMQTAPNNAWRQDHDPVTGGPLGVLIEDARTNFVLQSGSVGDVSKGWGLNAVTALVNAAVAPNGLTEATLITATADDAEARPRRDSVSIPINTDLTVSVFVKKTAASKDNLRFFLLLDIGAGGLFNYGLAEFNITTLQANPNGTGTTSAGIVDVGNGWLRCWFTVAGASNIRASTTLYLNLVDVAGSNRAAVGQELLYWGAQVEAGSFPTSYIPTTTAAATRAADSLSVPPGAWFNAAGFTIAVDVIDPGVTGIESHYVNLYSNTNNRQRISGSAATQRIIAYGLGGGKVISLYPTANYPLGLRRLAAAIAPGNQAFAVNGSIGATAAVTDAQIVGDPILYIGRFTTGAERMNGWVKNIRIWPRRLSDTELQAASVLS